MQSTFNLDKPGQLSAEAIRTALQSIQETHHGVTFTKEQTDTIYAIGLGGTLTVPTCRPAQERQRSCSRS
ncbi:MAG: hypothetical protein ACLP4V_02285 [Methylocella sp.]